MEILRQSESRQFESCVRCGKKTDYTVADSVSVRYHYIDGAGQLCDECYKKIAERKEEVKNPTYKNSRTEIKDE